MHRNNAADGLSRRTILKTAATGLTAVIAYPLIETIAGSGRAAAAAATSGPAAVTVPFDTGWLFGASADGGSAPGFDDSALATVTVPHSVAPLSWRNWDPSGWEQVWLYRKHFDAPANGDGMRVFLDFAGVLTTTSLTLNGTGLPGRTGGYLPFTAEVTDLLQDRDNVLAAVVDARFQQDVPPDRPDSASTSVDFHQPGGIYRDVALRLVPQIFVADLFAKPVNVLDDATRAVVIECSVDAAVAAAGTASLTFEVRDSDQVIASATTPLTIAAAGQFTVTATIESLAGVRLWDLDHPNLYDVVATLSVAGRSVHDYRTRIGFRTATFTKQGFFLNGSRVQLFGVNRHQWYPFAGGAMADRVQRRDAEILRTDLNCTMVRCSHYPQAEAFLNACDELGLMVWEEAPGWGYLGDTAWLNLAYRDIGDMIRRDRNHPSIIVWGARLNEVGDNTAFWTSTNELAHTLDDSRQTVAAMSGKHNDTDYQQDVFSQNDYTHSTGSDGMQQPDLQAPRTDLPYMVSECVGALSGPAKYYRRIDTQAVQQGQATAHARVHNIGASNDAYCGILAWSGYDYPSGNGNQYVGVKYTGVVDLFRIPKPGAAIYQAQVDPSVRPVIQPAFYWDFGATSPITAVGKAMICSNLDRLEVFVAGEHFASVTPDTVDYANLRYPPSFVDFSTVDPNGSPELRIDGYAGDKLALTQSFSADPATDRLSLIADDSTLVADGSDATRFVVRAVDRYGRPRPYVTGDVTFAVEGPADFVGDNPFAFQDAGGAGAVWLRSIRNSPGKVTLTATHPTLGTASAGIHVRQTTPGGPPAPYGTLSLAGSALFATPGATTTVTATFTNAGNPALAPASLTLHVPSGWTATATGPTSFDDLQPRAHVTVSWNVTVPTSATPQAVTLDVEAVYTAHGERGLTHALLTLEVPYASLAAAFNNIAITDDANVDPGNMDGVGNSYSAQALAALGITPGGAVTEAGVALTWPDVPTGTPDNAFALGQLIALSGAGSTLAFVGCGSPAASGSGTVYYADGTTSVYTITLDDYFSPPSTGNDVIATTSYINSAGVGGRVHGQRTQTVYLFGTTAATTPGKQVVAVALPSGQMASSGRTSGMHVFALGVG